MVNFGLNAAAILGLFLAVAGAGLFFLRSIRPELARDYDIFFAAVGLLCGIILLFNGWRLDPILQFGQFLLTGTAIFFAFESIRMRGVATEQARRNTPTVDRDRPVSRTRVYTEAELDQIDPYDNAYEGAKPNYSSPRLQGYDEPQPRTARRSERKRAAPSADLTDEPRRRVSRSRTESSDYVARAPEGDRYGYSERDKDRDRDIRPRRRPPASTADAYDQWEKNNLRSAPRSRPRPSIPSIEDPYSAPTPTTKPERKPNPVELGRSYEPEDDYSNNLGSSYEDSDLGRSYDQPDESIPGDYVVDYQPVEEPEVDYSDDYDDSDLGDYDDYDDYDDLPEYNSQEDYPEQPERRKPINFNNDYD
ncbi:MAG TPA: Ycf66 family protein [Coleofasciculaceae cyanobacterium]|jgi:hypothetical protein